MVETSLGKFQSKLVTIAKTAFFLVFLIANIRDLPNTFLAYLNIKSERYE